MGLRELCAGQSLDLPGIPQDLFANWLYGLKWLFSWFGGTGAPGSQEPAFLLLVEICLFLLGAFFFLETALRKGIRSVTPLFLSLQLVFSAPILLVLVSSGFGWTLAWFLLGLYLLGAQLMSRAGVLVNTAWGVGILLLATILHPLVAGALLPAFFFLWAHRVRLSDRRRSQVLYLSLLWLGLAFLVLRALGPLGGGSGPLPLETVILGFLGLGGLWLGVLDRKVWVPLLAVAGIGLSLALCFGVGLGLPPVLMVMAGLLFNSLIEVQVRIWEGMRGWLRRSVVVALWLAVFLTTAQVSAEMLSQQTLGYNRIFLAKLGTIRPKVILAMGSDLWLLRYHYYWDPQVRVLSWDKARFYELRALQQEGKVLLLQKGDHCEDPCQPEVLWGYVLEWDPARDIIPFPSERVMCGLELGNANPCSCDS